MASIISASTTSNTALNMTADTTGVLQLATGATPTTAVTIDTSQNVGIGTASPTTFSGYKTLELANSSGSAVSLVTGTSVIAQTISNNSGGTVLIGARSNHPLILTTNDTERARIDTSGRITTPNQPAFIAGIAATSDSSLAAGAFVPFNTTALSSGACNIGSHFSTSTNKFTAPVAGTYLFTYTLYYTNSGSSTLNMQPCINVNSGYPAFTSGDAYGVNTITPNSAGGIVAFSWTGLLKLAANDVVGVSNRSGNILRIYQGHSNFSGYLIG